MFDQNWLKRYMLSNQPGQGPPGAFAGAPPPAFPGQPPGGQPFGQGPAPGPALALPPRNPPTPGRAPGGVLGFAEDASAPPSGPAESARLRERTGLNTAPSMMPRLTLQTGPAASDFSARAAPPYFGSEGLAPALAPAAAATLPAGAAAFGAPQRPAFSLPSSARAPDAAGATGQAFGGAAPPMSGGFFGAQGPFGYAPFDNSANMPGNLFNYGREGAVKHYVVMCKDDVEVRASPTYADDTRIGHFLHPGQVILVDDRRMVTGSWFIHLADGRGWVFETKERLLVMTEVQDFERGLWHYSVVCEDDVETRLTPTYSDDSRTGLILGSGDCIAVDERCSVGGARFLKLADGRGWVFETKDRLLVMSEVRAKAQEARDFARGLWHYTVVCDDDVEIRAAPTYSDEARTGLTIHPGDCVAVDERCRVAAVWFLRLADGRGWVFESKDSRRVMMQLH